MTFDQCAKAYIDSHTAGWRNAKHAQQWTNTLATYVYPEFGSVPVGDVILGGSMTVLVLLGDDPEIEPIVLG